MATSASETFSSFISAVASFGRWIWAAPKKLVEGFSWFSSKKMDIPDTEQGRRLKQALLPDSLFDKVAQTWAYASFWTKGAVLGGTTLVFGLLGLVFGASIVLSIASMVIGLSIHGLLVAHHEGRVKRIMGLVKEQEFLRDEVGDALKSVQGEVVDFIHAQKKETEATFIQFKKDAQDLTKAVTVVDEQLASVVSVNKQLEEVGQHIETTLHEVDEQALAWNKGLEQHQEVLGTVIDASHTFSGLVDDVANSHKAFDTTVVQLHEAVAELTKPLDESDDEACEVRVDLSAYTEQTHQMKEQLDAFDARSKQRKENRAKGADLLIEESLLVTHREGIRATNETLGKLELQRKALTGLRATNGAALQKVLVEPTIQKLHEQESDTHGITSCEVRSTDLAWLETVRQSMSARQERMDALKSDRLALHEEGALEDHQTLIGSIETDLKARAEQRKLRRAQLDTACRFFVEPTHNADLDKESRLSIGVH